MAYNEIDRYQVELDCRPFVGRLAMAYKTTRYWHVDVEAKSEFLKQTLQAYNDIPTPIRFVDGAEPYVSAEEMACKIKQDGVFLVKYRNQGHHPLGSAHMLFRAAHDWYGHVLTKNPFTMDGELAAYHAHEASGMFSKQTLPLVWSEVVLENAFRLWHGHWHWISKPVFDPQFGCVPELMLAKPWQKIWRLEMGDGTGPYSNNNLGWNCLVEVQGGGSRPVPWYDTSLQEKLSQKLGILKSEGGGWLFGFGSREYLEKWFPKDVRIKLQGFDCAKGELRIAQYEAPDDAVLCGDWQAVFDPKRARCISREEA